jgi:predicted ATPase/DNA-binding CsgD family transcriptional regulator
VAQEQLLLPAPRVPLIGREQERARLRARFADERSRLVTLTGPPGVGKTLLAHHVAWELRSAYAGGAAYVALDALRDVEFLPAAIGAALGLREEPGRPPIESLHNALRDRELLLLLDNFEHLVAAAPFVDELLAASPALALLVTSRIALGLRAELLERVEPLPLPAVRSQRRSGDGAIPPATASAAVELFVTRARALQPALPATPAVAAEIAEICRRLDGLPLAIELAAARAKLFTPREIAEHLERRLTFLTSGFRDLPPRQRTLRAAIDWSYSLLSPAEQRAFQRLSVFAGGCTVEALEFVAEDDEAPENGGPDDVPFVELLTTLIDHSLVQRRDGRSGGSRFAMLETLREYAAEQLEAGGAAEAVRIRLAAWFATFAQRAGRELTGAGQVAWLDSLEDEQDNLRAVLGWAIERGESRLGLEVASALWRFWLSRGYLSEGRRWLESLVQSGEHTPPRLRALALHGAAVIAEAQAGYADATQLAERSLALFREAGGRGADEALLLLGALAYRRSDYESATEYVEEGLALARAAADRTLSARSLNMLGLIAMDRGLFERADGHLSAALVLARELGDLRTAGIVLNNLGLCAHRRDDLDASQRYLEESVALQRRRGDKVEIARSLLTLAMLVRGRGEPDAALPFAREALTLAEETGNRYGSMVALSQLAPIARAQGDLDTARRYVRELLDLAADSDYPMQILSALSEASANADAAGRPRQAVRLLAAAEALRESMGLAQHASMQQQKEQELEALRDRTGSDAFAAEWAAGTAMSQDEALAYALAEAEITIAAPPIGRPAGQEGVRDPAEKSAAPAAAEPLARLTKRQVEILKLLAAGESNEAIAGRLVISERTVEHHITNIYNKIGASGRVDATAYAHRHGLVR